MSKNQIRVFYMFVVGIVLCVLGVVLAAFDVNIIWVKIVLYPATFMLCFSAIYSALFPIKKEG